MKRCRAMVFGFWDVDHHPLVLWNAAGGGGGKALKYFAFVFLDVAFKTSGGGVPLEISGFWL